LATGRGLGRNGKVSRFAARYVSQFTHGEGNSWESIETALNVPLKNPERRPAKKAKIT